MPTIDLMMPAIERVEFGVLERLPWPLYRIIGLVAAAVFGAAYCVLALARYLGRGLRGNWSLR